MSLGFWNSSTRCLSSSLALWYGWWNTLDTSGTITSPVISFPASSVRIQWSQTLKGIQFIHMIIVCKFFIPFFALDLSYLNYCGLVNIPDLQIFMSFIRTGEQKIEYSVMWIFFKRFVCRLLQNNEIKNLQSTFFPNPQILIPKKINWSAAW